MNVVWRIALRLLWYRKLLNTIAVVGVTLGVLTLIGMRGMMSGFQDKFLSNILKSNPHIAIFDKELREAPTILEAYEEGPFAARIAHQTPSDRQMRIKRPEEILRAIEEMEGVTAAAPLLVGSAIVAFGQQQLSVEVRGIDPQRQERVTPLTGYMQEGSLKSFWASPDGVLLGSGVAKNVGAKTGDIVVCSTPSGQRLNLKVSGIFETSVTPVDYSRIYTALRTAQTLLGKPEVVGRIDVRLTDPELAYGIAERAERVFRYDAESWQETYANFLAIFKQQDIISGLVNGAILIVGGFSILVIQIMIVLQKVRDIAILRSTGFRRRDILRIFLYQGAAIALLGSLLGCLGGHGLLVFLGNLKVHQEALVKSETFLVRDDGIVYVYATAFALLTGIIASLLPAVRASQVEPVEVLRGAVG